MGTKPSYNLGKLFLILFAIFRAYGHRLGMMASGHWCFACKQWSWISCRSLYIPFWWCAFTPQYKIVWPCSFMWFIKCCLQSFYFPHDSVQCWLLPFWRIARKQFLPLVLLCWMNLLEGRYRTSHCKGRWILLVSCIVWYLALLWVLLCPAIADSKLSTEMHSPG